MISKSIKLCLAGDGWGALAALKSLCLCFKNIAIVTSDIDMKRIAVAYGLELKDRIIDVDAELYICAGYKPIIPMDFLLSRRLINVHYSLLPKYRGMHSTVWAILNGESELGLTVHEINEGIDDGPIIDQYVISYHDQNSCEIMEMCNDYISKNLALIVSNYLNGKIKPVKQDFSHASWVCKRNYEDCLVDFDWNIAFLRRFFKALVAPYPLPRIKYKNTDYELLHVDLIEQDYYMTNGRVVNIDINGVWIKVNDGFLVIRELLDIDSGRKLNPSTIFKIGVRLK